MDNLEFRKIRKTKGYTQVELGEILGLNPEQISRLENGHCQVKKALGIVIKSLPYNNKEAE